MLFPANFLASTEKTLSCGDGKGNGPAAIIPHGTWRKLESITPVNVKLTLKAVVNR